MIPKSDRNDLKPQMIPDVYRKYTLTYIKVQIWEIQMTTSHFPLNVSFMPEDAANK